MLKLALPKNILDKEVYLSLPVLQKEEYIHNFLKEVLELNPNGVTTSQIDNATYLGHSTIWHHLEILASRSQCFKIERGDVFVYYPTKVVEPLEELDVKGAYYLYCFNIVENMYGKFIRIQMKQDTTAGNPRTHCGVLISSKSFGEVLDKLNKIKETHLNEKSK